MRALLLAGMMVALVATGAAALEWHEITLPDGPGSAEPRLLDVATDGGIVWFSTEFDGIIGYDGASWVLHTEANSGLRSNRYRFVMFVDAAGDKWTAKDSALCIDRLDDGGTFADKSDDTWSYYSSTAQLASKRVFSIAEDSRGNKWCGIRDEAEDEPSVVELLIENGPGTADDEWLAFGDTYDPDFFTAKDVRGLTMDQSDRLWLIYDRGGVDVWDFGDYDSFEDDTLVHYGVVDGLPSDSVHEVHVGGDGRVWVGADNGIAVFDPVTEMWSSVEELPTDRVNDIDTDAQGHVWAATDDGVVMLYASGEVAIVYTTADGLRDDEIELIAVDQIDGTVWAVSKDSGTGQTYLNTLQSGFGPENRVFAFPNPWNETEAPEKSVKILGAPEGSKVEIFDITGQEIRRLDATREPFLWDSLDADLNEVASGVYIVRVVTPSGEQLFTKVAIIR